MLLVSVSPLHIQLSSSQCFILCRTLLGCKGSRVRHPLHCVKNPAIRSLFVPQRDEISEPACYEVHCVTVCLGPARIETWDEPCQSNARLRSRANAPKYSDCKDATGISSILTTWQGSASMEHWTVLLDYEFSCPTKTHYCTWCL